MPGNQQHLYRLRPPRIRTLLREGSVFLCVVGHSRRCCARGMMQCTAGTNRLRRARRRGFVNRWERSYRGRLVSGVASAALPSDLAAWVATPDPCCLQYRLPIHSGLRRATATCALLPSNLLRTVSRSTAPPKTLNASRAAACDCVSRAPSTVYVATSTPPTHHGDHGRRSRGDRRRDSRAD